MWITKTHITLLEIKMEKFKNIYVLSKITKIRPILVGKIIFLWHLNVFSMRRKNSVSRVVLFTFLQISFMSGFNSRQVDSHICFCIHLLQNVHGILVREWEWKRQILSQDDYESSFDHVDLLKDQRDSQRLPDHALRAADLSQVHGNPQPQSFTALCLSAVMSSTDGNVYFLPLMYRSKLTEMIFQCHSHTLQWWRLSAKQMRTLNS